MEQEEKELLLDKLRFNALSREEALRLKPVLEDEQKTAIEENDLMLAIIIGWLTAAISYHIFRTALPSRADL